MEVNGNLNCLVGLQREKLNHDSVTRVNCNLYEPVDTVRPFLHVGTTKNGQVAVL